ncbi:hypothetical protein LTR16_003245, partial [Cryomyces antarcticus]
TGSQSHRQRLMSQRLEQRGRATTSLHARGVSAYPVLSPGEFKSACTALSEWFGGCWRGLGGCRSVRLTEDVRSPCTRRGRFQNHELKQLQHGRVCLRITKDTFTAHGRGHLGPPPDSRDDETPGQGPASDGFEEFDEVNDANRVRVLWNRPSPRSGSTSDPDGRGPRGKGGVQHRALAGVLRTRALLYIE